MSFKGRTVDLLSEAAAAGPWRSALERSLVSLAHRYPTSRILLSFCRHFGSKLIRRGGDGFSRVAVFDTGGAMLCSGESFLVQISLLYYFLGTIIPQHEDERGVVRLFRRFIREGDVFFDLGANLGFYSCYVLPLCGQFGAVHSFEPNLCLIPHLRRLNEVNGRFGDIHLNAVAVGRQPGESLPLYGPDRIGCSSLYPHEWLNRDSTIAVPVVTIDEYVRQNGITRIDVVKLDVEGAELDALEGMRETLRVCPPKLIVCELTIMPEHNEAAGRCGGGIPRACSAADPRQVADFLGERGYELWDIADDGRLSTSKTSAMNIGSGMKLTNVAFIRPELRRLRSELFVDR